MKTKRSEIRNSDGTFASSPLRSAARDAGEKLYEPDFECLHGHRAMRYVSNNGCSECLKVSVRKYQKKHRSDLLLKKRKWAKDNPEKNLAQSLRWYAENKSKALLLNAESKKRHWDVVLLSSRRAASKRRAALLYRLPSWANLDEIRAFYDNCPSGMVVDHVIPLQGRIVSGLHVAENLQYLSREENARKGNKYHV